MGKVFYFIIIFLIIFGLVEFLSKKFEGSRTFKVILTISFVLGGILSVLTFIFSPSYKPMHKKIENDTIQYNIEKNRPNTYPIENNNSYTKEEREKLYKEREEREKQYRETLERENIQQNTTSQKPDSELEKRYREELEEIEKFRKLREGELNKSNQLDQLVKGKIAYEVPDTMNVGKNYNATVIITKAMNDSILFENFHQGNFQKEEIKVTTRVKVVLIDPTENNFDITSLNTLEQLVDDTTNTVWKWNITPKRGGDNVLVLRVTVKVLDQLGENYKDIRVFEKTIKVYTPILTRLRHFIGNYWQWLSTVIVIPLGIWGYKILSNRRKKNAELIQEQERKQKEFEKWITQK